MDWLSYSGSSVPTEWSEFRRNWLQRHYVDHGLLKEIWFNLYACVILPSIVLAPEYLATSRVLSLFSSDAQITTNCNIFNFWNKKNGMVIEAAINCPNANPVFQSLFGAAQRTTHNQITTILSHVQAIVTGNLWAIRSRCHPNVKYKPLSSSVRS